VGRRVSLAIPFYLSLYLASLTIPENLVSFLELQGTLLLKMYRYGSKTFLYDSIGTSIV
jgi:hypothetical protein